MDRNHQALNCDCLQIPLRSNCVDLCICIAVLHHLATNDRRLKALMEIYRVLVVGGRALVCVWAKEQFRDQIRSAYLKQSKTNGQNSVNKTSEKFFVESINANLPVHLSRSEFTKNDLLVPWKLNQKKGEEKEPETHLRYYHVFEETEFRCLCEQVPNCKIIDYYYEQGNWCVVFEKTQTE